MNEKHLVITIRDPITSEESEELEDIVAETLGELGFENSEVWSEVTGNTTTAKTD